MSDVVDYTEVPYLQEILNYLPIDPADEEDVINYIQNITNLIAVNYKYGQYQFAYFGLHLLYMTFIYCTAWKIGQIEPERYKDAIVFARPYSGREKLSTNELLICNEMSINGLITEHRGYQTKLRDFKKSVSDHCLEMGYK